MKRASVSKSASALALFLFLLSVYLLTYSPRFHSSDGLAMFAMSENLARRGSIDIEQLRWMGLQQGTFGLDGTLYLRKAPGVSILALPLVWLGLAVPVFGPATAALLLNSIITALTGTLVLLYLRRLGYGEPAAMVAALTFGLATPAWPYAKTFFSDPLAGFCLLLAAYALLAFRQRGGVFGGAFSGPPVAGLALSLSVITRYANAVVIPVYGLMLVHYALLRAEPVPPGVEPPRSVLRHWARALWRPCAAFAVPLALTAAAAFYYNYARYGNVLDTGYLPEETFSEPILRGLAGLLVSPGRGLFLYAPVLCFSLFTALPFVRKHTAEGLLALSMVAVHLVLYGKWFMWHGGYAWGPRFLVPTLPFFVLPMAGAAGWAVSRSRKKLRALFWAVFAVSVPIQVLGLAVDFSLVQGYLLETGLPLFAPVTFFRHEYSPLLLQFRYLAPENLDFAWADGGRINAGLLALLAGLVLLNGLALWRPSRNSTAISASGVLFAVTALLYAAHLLHPPGIAAASETLNRYAGPGDLVLFNGPEVTPHLSDTYRGRALVMGLNEGGSVMSEGLGPRLEEVTAERRVVWWLPGSLPGGQSGVELWLMAQGFRAYDESKDGTRLVMYALPHGLMAAYDEEVTLGGEIALDGYSFTPIVPHGGPFMLELRWRALRETGADYHVFVHIVDSSGRIVAQRDGQPVNWTRPTSTWRAGEEITDRYGILITDKIPTGEYVIVVGMYLPGDGTRLTASTGENYVSPGTMRVAR